MKYLKFIIIMVFFCDLSVYSQEKNKIITRGETLSDIGEITHEVLAKETLYGIAKQYGITVANLYKANPIVESSGLKIGQKINIPSKRLAVVSTARKEDTKTIKEIIVHEVSQKETLYGIAKRYGITIADLNNANPILETESLKIGQKINVPLKEGYKPNPILVQEKVNSIPGKPIVVKERTMQETAHSQESITESNGVIVHEVLPKETKYGIAKQYGITIHELERQNPSIVGNLSIGFKLTIQSPNCTAQNKPIKKEESVKSLEENTPVKTEKTSLNNSELADQLIQTASENLGSRYQTGGTSKSGFDCSGLMYTTFGAFDIKLPRSSFEQSSYGTKINPEEAQKGDLIFFKTNGRGQINHVGMVVEVNSEEIKFIHSSVQSGVIISSTKEKYYENNFTQINRVLQ